MQLRPGTRAPRWPREGRHRDCLHGNRQLAALTAGRFSSSFRNCSTRRTTRARRPSPCARLMVTAFCPAATSVADAALVWMRVCPSRASCFMIVDAPLTIANGAPNALASDAPTIVRLRAKAMPRECSATADAERRLGEGARPSTPSAWVSSITRRPPASAASTRKRGQLRRPAAGRAEAVGHDQRPSAAGAARLCAAPFQRDRVMMRESLDLNAIRLRAPSDAPARDRIGCRVEQDQRALWALRPGTNPGTDAAWSGNRQRRLHRRGAAPIPAPTLGHPAGSASAAGRPRVRCSHEASDALGWPNPRYSADVKSSMATSPAVSGCGDCCPMSRLTQMHRRHRGIDTARW